MIASLIGQIGRPFYAACGWLLAACYALVPNYAVALVLLTAVTMLVLSPFAVRATRQTMRLRALGPDIRRVKDAFRAGCGASAPERLEARRREQEELSALYHRHGVKPTDGIVAGLVQLPVFVVLTGTIRGFVHRANDPVTHHLVAAPLYLQHRTAIFRSIVAADGGLHSFGLNLADSLRSSGLAFGARLWLVGLVAVAVALQYASARREKVPGREDEDGPGALLRHIVPLASVAVYVAVPGGVDLYFVVSSLFRLATKELCSWGERRSGGPADLSAPRTVEAGRRSHAGRRPRRTRA